MLIEQLKNRNIHTELLYSASRSSGPGGQNVNKVNTKVELRFNIRTSSLLSDFEKERLLLVLANKITQGGDIILVGQSERSQIKNKIAVTERFYALIANALTPPKKRTPSRRTKASIQRRLHSKKKHAQKKMNRKFKAD